MSFAIFIATDGNFFAFFEEEVFATRGTDLFGWFVPRRELTVGIARAAIENCFAFGSFGDDLLAAKRTGNIDLIVC